MFKDITGLDANQQNVIRTYLSNQDNAKAFGEMAKEMAMQTHNTQNSGKIMDSLNAAKSSGALNQADYSKLVKDHLQQQIDGGQTAKAESQQAAPSLTKAAVDAANRGADVKAFKSDNEGNTEAIEAGQVLLTAGGQGALEDALTVSINLDKYSGPDVRAFEPGNSSGRAEDKSGRVTLRAVVNNAPAGSTWRWTVADPTKVQLVAPSAYITDAVAGHPGLVDLTFSARDSGGVMLAQSTTKLCVPQFVLVKEEAAAFNAELAAYQLDDVKDAVLQRTKLVVEHLLSTCNVRTVWALPPFNEALPAQLDAGGFAAGEYNTLTIHGTNAGDPSTAGETAAAGAGASKPDEKIDVWPGAYRTPGTDVGVEVAGLVTTLSGLDMTVPAIKTLWIEIMGRMCGETIAHEICHSLLAFAIPTGHNSPPVPWDLMNRGDQRSFLQRTGIEIIQRATFPQPGTYRDGGIGAISGLMDVNQQRIDAVFPVPPTFT